VCGKGARTVKGKFCPPNAPGRRLLEDTMLEAQGGDPRGKSLPVAGFMSAHLRDLKGRRLLMHRPTPCPTCMSKYNPPCRADQHKIDRLVECAHPCKRHECCVNNKPCTAVSCVWVVVRRAACYNFS
jgi:hypothetical protein